MGKRCTKCGETKPLSEFSKSKVCRFGVRATCKVCDKNYYRETKDGQLEQRSRYYTENREKISTQRKESWRKSQNNLSEKDKMEEKIKRREKYFKWAYKISLSEYNEMVVRQGGVCAICGGDNNGKHLYVDHDHDTGRVRGLLCNSCNAGMGLMKDDMGILTKAIYYLIMNQQMFREFSNA